MPIMGVKYSQGFKNHVTPLNLATLLATFDDVNYGKSVIRVIHVDYGECADDEECVVYHGPISILFENEGWYFDWLLELPVKTYWAGNNSAPLTIEVSEANKDIWKEDQKEE